MIWTVYAKPDAIGHDIVAVPEARSSWAFVFGTLWLLRHRLWWAALVFLLIGLILNAVGQVALAGIGDEPLWWVSPTALMLAVLPRFWLALEGNELRRRKLERRGYRLAEVVEAENRADAEVIAVARDRDRVSLAELEAERDRLYQLDMRDAYLAPHAHRPEPPLPLPRTERERTAGGDKAKVLDIATGQSLTVPLASSPYTPDPTSRDET